MALYHKDCLCFDDSSLLMEKIDAQLDAHEPCPGDHRLKECPASSTKLVVQVATHQDDVVEYVKREAN